MTRARSIALVSLTAVAIGAGSLALRNRSAARTAIGELPASHQLTPTAAPLAHPVQAETASIPAVAVRTTGNTNDPDPLAPLSAVTALPPGEERATGIAAVVNAVGRTDTPGALELAQALRSGHDDGTLEHRLQLWAEEAPTDAIAWVKAQPVSPIRDRLLARAAYVRVQSNPTEAIELLQLMSPNPANEPATQAVLKLWHQRDPAGAATWLAQDSKP